MIARLFRNFSDTLGPTRLQALFFLLAGTGLISLILNAVQGEWVRPAQSILVAIFVVGAAIIIGGALDRETRGRWTAIALPALGMVFLGLTVLPQFATAFVGGAIGWVVASVLIFRPRAPMAYRDAVKHLRRNEYAEAVKVMDGVIKLEPKETQHYRFRAEILRLWGKLDRARRDYQEMTRIDPNSAVGYNGLAEVDLQAGRYDTALEAAQRAYELAPNEWVAAYNLGMIEDRLGHADETVTHLRRALDLKVPETRHRLLIHFYLARAYSRQSDMTAAESEVEALHRDRGGLKEWQTLLDSDQAATLRAVLGADVDAAQRLVNGDLTVSALANETQP